MDTHEQCKGKLRQGGWLHPATLDSPRTPSAAARAVSMPCISKTCGRTLPKRIDLFQIWNLSSLISTFTRLWAISTVPKVFFYHSCCKPRPTSNHSLASDPFQPLRLFPAVFFFAHSGISVQGLTPTNALPLSYIPNLAPPFL